MVMPKSGQVAIVSDHFIFHDQCIQRRGPVSVPSGWFGAWERVFVIALSVRDALLDI
jgi:hypothetical protein